MTNLLAILLLSVVPQDCVARESCDLIEHNRFYDEHGRLVFEQVIFYDWSDPEARYHVRDWRLVKNAGQVPHVDHENGGYVAMWDDGDQMRRVHALSIRETWTQHDPELAEREYLPKENRAELRKRTKRYRITGRESCNFRIPKHAQAVRSQGMSEQQSNCASVVEKSGAVEYRDVPGFPGYRVGSDGTLWSCRKHGYWKQMSCNANRQGYICVLLRTGTGKPTRRFVHQLVLEAFGYPRPDGFIVCHGNDQPADNRLANLRWGTHKDNSRDMLDRGRTLRGEKCPRSKLSASDVVAIRELAAAGIPNDEIASRFGCNYRNISCIVLGQTWIDAGGPIQAEARKGGTRSLTLPPNVNLSRLARDHGISRSLLCYHVRCGKSIDNAIAICKAAASAI